MRRLVLILLVIGALIGLPRLADRFRDAQANLPAASETAHSPAVAPAGDLLAPRQNGDGTAPPLAHPLPVSLTAVPPAPSAAAAAAPPLPAKAVPEAAAELPASHEELVLAIQKELARLGFYEGPATDRWTKKMWLAARRFTRSAHLRLRLKPTVELLEALRMVKSECGGNCAGIREDGKQPDPQQDREHRTDLAAPNAIREVSVAGDTYLPPWMMGGRGVSAGTAAEEATRGSPVNELSPPQKGPASAKPLERGEAGAIPGRIERRHARARHAQAVRVRLAGRAWRENAFARSYSRRSYRYPSIFGMNFSWP